MPNPATLSPDTSVEALWVHVAVLRRLGIEGRAKLTFDLSDSLRRITEAGVRQRHPDYDDRAVRLAATRLAIGDTLFRQAFPGIEVEP